MTVELTISEEWIRQRLQLHHTLLDDVRTLCLPGGIEGKISHLGISLKKFERLKTLDLSYNALVSVSGLEHLKKLERLSLYFNKISAFQEIGKLSKLKSLRELDLRLNPVVKRHPEYQLHLVLSLFQLRKLNNCPVGERERKAALMLMTPDTENEPPKPETGSTLNLFRQSSVDRRVAAVNRLTRGLQQEVGIEKEPNHLNRTSSLFSSLPGNQTRPQTSLKEEISDEVIYLVNDYDLDPALQSQNPVRPGGRKSQDFKASSIPLNAQRCKRGSSTNGSAPWMTNNRPRVTFAQCYIEGSHSIHPLPVTRDKKPSQVQIPSEAVFTPNPQMLPSPTEEDVLHDSQPPLQVSGIPLEVGHLASHSHGSSGQWAHATNNPVSAAADDTAQRGSYRKALELLFSMVREHWTTGKTYPQHYKVLFTRAMQVLSLMERELASSEKKAEALSAQAEVQEEKHQAEVEQLRVQLETAHNTIGGLNEQLRSVLEENVALQHQILHLQRSLLAATVREPAPSTPPAH